MIDGSDHKVDTSVYTNDIANIRIHGFRNISGDRDVQEILAMLCAQYWKKYIFWSDGYLTCSIGEVSSATIEKYIAEQG